MVPSYPSEIEESNAQFYGVWKTMARKFACNETSESPGVSISWPGAKWPILNVVGLSSPVMDHADLEAKIQQAVGFTQTKPVMGMVVACTEWLPKGRAGKNAAAFAAHGLAPALSLRGMVADRLLRPQRTLPDLEFRRVASPETSRALVDLNAISYDAPLEFGREISDIANFWDGVFAYVGYREGQAVTAAATFLENGRLYVGFVATLPEARRNGYAEAVMRHSLEAAARSSGLSRSVLHATEAGCPVYEAMGYRQVAHFQAYLPQAIVKGMSNPA